MRRFRLLFLLFSVALLALMGLLIQRALRTVTLERQMRHQAIAERVFDEMERGLSRLLEGEEEVPFDTYGLATGRELPFVLGHFQIDPDGSVHALASPAEQQPARLVEVERIVGAYWRVGRAAVMDSRAVAAQVPGTTFSVGQLAASGPAPQSRDRGAAKNEVSAFDALRSLNKGVLQRQKKAAEYESARQDEAAPARAGIEGKPAPREERHDKDHSEIELPPMAGRLIDDRHLMLYRTVVRDTRGYRQGALLDVEQLGTWLRGQGLGGDVGESELAAYANVTFATRFAAPPISASAFAYQHRFAEPFDDLTALLALQPLPSVGSITYVYALSALLLAAGVLGLAALYRMVSVVVTFAERRSNFVAAVSHELKTPLTAIRMYGEMLRDGMVPSEDKRAEYYRHITVESERLSRLINNVLEFSRLENGTREAALSVGSVAPVVREVAELLRPHVEGQGFALQLEIAPDLQPVRFDHDALVQVLCNLVDNAVKYAGAASPKQIVLRCGRDGSGVFVTVRDHGPGVPARHLGKIFEPFYRGESELTRRSKGTGLGLALVRGLAERMGARVSGRNAPGGGFEVEIVFAQAAER